MDINSFVQFIQNVGFPIACCGALFWQMNKLNEQHKQEITTIMEQHKEEVASLREALDRNTQAMDRLGDRLGGASCA